MIFPTPENYIPKKYSELTIQEGVIQKNVNNDHIYKTMRLGTPSTLKIKDSVNGDVKSFVCNPFVLSACIITYKGKRFIEIGEDIYGVNATVKWAYYMGNKIVYEVISRGEVLVSYNESVYRHKSSVKIRLMEIEKEKNKLAWAVLFFMLALGVIVRNESKH